MAYFVGDPREIFHADTSAMVMLGGALLLSPIPEITNLDEEKISLIGTTIYGAVIVEDDAQPDVRRPGRIVQMLLAAPVETAAYVIEGIINHAKRFGCAEALEAARDQAKAHYALADQ